MSNITDKNFKSNNSEFMRNKEIEEIAKVILDSEILCNDCGENTDSYCAEAIAETLYNEGYRKQSVGEWIDKPTGAYSRMQSRCSACGKHSGIGGIESNRHKPYCPNCGAYMRKEDEGK